MGGLAIRKEGRNAPFFARNFSAEPHVIVRILHVVVVHIHGAIMRIEVHTRHVAVGKAVLLPFSVHNLRRMKTHSSVSHTG